MDGRTLVVCEVQAIMCVSHFKQDLTLCRELRETEAHQDGMPKRGKKLSVRGIKS